MKIFTKFNQYAFETNFKLERALIVFTKTNLSLKYILYIGAAAGSAAAADEDDEEDDDDIDETLTERLIGNSIVKIEART